MFRRILVPVDGSDIARRGLQAAIRLAKEQGGRIRLIHVVEIAPMITVEGGAYVADVLDAMAQAGKNVLAKAQAEAARSGLKAETVLIDNMPGHIADAIVRDAKKWRADLIVLGTHGRRGVTRLVMGSDAEQVVRLTAVPVLLIRAGAPKSRVKKQRLERTAGRARR